MLLYISYPASTLTAIPGGSTMRTEIEHMFYFSNPFQSDGNRWAGRREAATATSRMIRTALEYTQMGLSPVRQEGAANMRETLVAERSNNQQQSQAPPEAVETAMARGFALSHKRRSIRTTPPTYRWECPCQEPAVLLATYDPGGKVNIKVRDRYWHVFGFGQVQAICPKCAAEHVLDIRQLQDALDGDLEPDQMT